MGGNTNLIEDAMQLLDNVVDLSGQVARVDSHSCKETLSGSEMYFRSRNVNQTNGRMSTVRQVTLTGSKQRTQRVGNPTHGTKQRNEGGLRGQLRNMEDGERRYVYEGAQKQG